MEASIKEPNIKNFVRLLQCASRFGDDLNMHANKDVWELAVTNSSKSAFCLFKLKKSFFCRYRALGETMVDRRKGVKCQLLVKSVLAVLGKTSSVSNVERVDLTITDPDQSLRPKRRRKDSSTQTISDSKAEDEYEDGHSGDEEEPELRGIEAKLIMKILCRHGVTKKHSLHLGTSEFLRAEVDPNSTPSYMSVTARALRDMLDHFSVISSTAGIPNGGGGIVRSENQLGWMFDKNEVRVKSWEGSSSLLSTEIKVDQSMFDDYWVEADRVDLTIPMKEFRAALNLAEQLNIRLNIAFSEPTQPVTLTSDPNEAEDQPYDIFCAIATTNCDAFSDIPFDRKPPRTINSMSSASAAQPQNGSSSNTSQARPKLGSEALGKRKRSTLSMSANPSVSQNGSAVAVVIRAPPPPPAQSQNQDQTDESEALFLPHSQPGGSQEREDGAAFPSTSQRVVLTQQEIMDISGMGDLDPEDLLDGMDDLEEQEELERQEEERLSQRNEESLVRGQSGMVMDETIPLPATSQALDGGLDGKFRLDESIFVPGPDETNLDDRSIVKHEPDHDEGPEQAEKVEEEDKENQEEIGREIDDEAFEDEDEMELPATQAYKSTAQKREFTTLFED